MNKKGQIVITDLFIALFLFSTLIISLIFTWNFYIKRLDSNLEYNTLQVSTFQITDALAKSYGYPANWENDPDNTLVFGLASNDRNISSKKILTFVNTDYDYIRERFKIKNYNFYFKATDLAGTIVQIEGKNLEQGIMPSGNHDLSISLRRYVILKNAETIMEFTLWK